jgi:hypothetical protein
VSALGDLATRTHDATHTYGDLLHIVHIYVVEPHPQSPELSPYSGEEWTREYSDRGQPETYAARVALALEILPELQGEQLLLVDDLTPEPLNNPVWCTYGPCPNCAYLIQQDGHIHTVQTWVSPAELQIAIDLLLL